MTVVFVSLPTATGCQHNSDALEVSEDYSDSLELSDCCILTLAVLYDAFRADSFFNDSELKSTESVPFLLGLK